MKARTLVLVILTLSLVACGTTTSHYGKQAIDLMQDVAYLPATIGFVLDAFPSAAESGVMDEFMSYPTTVSAALESLNKLVPPPEARKTHADLREWLTNMRSVSERANIAFKKGDRVGLEEAYRTAVNLSGEAQRIIDQLGEVVRAGK